MKGHADEDLGGIPSAGFVLCIDLAFLLFESSIVCY